MPPRKCDVGWSSFVLVWAPHSPKCIKVSAIQTWKMDEDNGAFLTIFLINCQSNCTMNDSNIIWCSIPYQRSHRCSFPLWLNLRPVLPSYYHHHHSDMKGEKQVLHHCQGETLILRHLHSPPSSSGCINVLPRCALIGWHWKAGILLMLKASRHSALPFHAQSHSFGGTRGQSTLLVVIVKEISTVEFRRKRNRTWPVLKKKEDNIIYKWIYNLLIYVDSWKNLLGFCELNVTMKGIKLYTVVLLLLIQKHPSFFQQ